MVKILDNDFDFEVRRYKSLSGIGRQVHHPDASHLCQRTIILHQGRIMAEGPTIEIFQNDTLLADSRLEFGINETAQAVPSPWDIPVPGYYYVHRDHPAAGDSGNPYGTPAYPAQHDTRQSARRRGGGSSRGL